MEPLRGPLGQRAPLRRTLPWQEPWALTLKLASQLGSRGLVLLEGDGSRLGRHAVLGVDPLEVVECRGVPGGVEAADPFASLEAMASSGGAWLGWLAYEAGAWVEPGSHWPEPEMAVLWAARHDPLVHFDRAEQLCWLEGSHPQRLAALETRILALADAPPPEDPAWPGIPAAHWHWHSTPEAYEAGVRKLQEWIACGDLFQANLTLGCSAELPFPPDPLALHARLRQRCPAPFSGLAVAGEEAVISASPERFLRLDAQGHVQTRPIKGTRPRSTTPEVDAAAAAELVCDPKDRAENVMIVDLLRNDLGRVCRPGSLQVPQLVGLESYAQVHHLTSVVEGQLRPDADVVDLLRACWPGGSISGAPKVRACQRLHELEPVPRGPYCGSLFHLGADGQLDSNILIRTLMVRGTRLRVHAGGGIVADSDPAAEAAEMGWKLLPLLEALA
ncbi:MAG: anthranilate synthase component I family protein [Cyanobacteriota bacterium]|nr:anthranilate synthase component I family protein [Cyanobacteriota bacterium]